MYKLPDLASRLRPRGEGRGRRQIIISAMALLLGLTWTLTGRINRASAATITVTNTNDSGGGSLRQAIADASPGDRINFNLPAGSTITLMSQLLINKDLTIAGPGANALTVSGNNLVRVIRVGVPNPKVDLQLTGLTLANGLADLEGGGAISNFSEGTLTLRDCVISGNTASDVNTGLGGAIHNHLGGTVRIENCQVSSNTATSSSGEALGGGLYNRSTGAVTISNSQFLSNFVSGLGLGAGGAIFNKGTGTVTITESTVSGNLATGFFETRGGGIDNSGGGSLRIINSTLSGNLANARPPVSGPGGTSSGGAIYGSVSASNCTLSGNGVNTGVINVGGAIANGGRGVVLENCTIAGNSAAGGTLKAGGVYSNGGSVITQNTIIALNTVSDGGGGADVFGRFLSLGYNFIGKSDGSSGFVNGVSQDQVGSNAMPLDPKLKLDAMGKPELAGNGGPTKTIALLSGSPAIDQGSETSAFTDQRGVPRTLDRPDVQNAVGGNGSDIGAFEFPCPLPQAVCKNATVFLDANGMAAIGVEDIDGGTDTCGVTNYIISGALFSCANLGANTVTLRVVDYEGNSSQCEATVTVLDNLPPSINAPANLTVTTPQNGCMTAGCAAVNFPVPVATDNCAVARVVCNPAPGSCFPLGTTSVTCTATDTSGNTASSSFTVSVFDVCLQDDSNPGTSLLLNSSTGEYRLCCGGVTYSGRGQVTISGCVTTLQHNTTERRVMAKVDKTLFRGSASFQSPLGTTRCTIADRDTRNNSCACQ